jgi:hypothetical protein
VRGTVDFDRVYRIVDKLAEIASGRARHAGAGCAHWVMNKPGVEPVIIGAATRAQLRDNLGPPRWRLTDRGDARARRGQRTSRAVPDVAPAQVRESREIRGCRVMRKLAAIRTTITRLTKISTREGGNGSKLIMHIHASPRFHQGSAAAIALSRVPESTPSSSRTRASGSG